MSNSRCGAGLPGVLVVVFGGLAGCADMSGRAAPTAQEALAAAEAENMFKAGYAAIADRFDEPVSAKTVAIDGLRGLSVLDQGLAVGLVGDAVSLSANGRTLVSWATPKACDVDGWANLTVRIWQAARTVSPGIAGAAEEDIYRAVFQRALATLDPYGRYSGPTEARANRQRRDGYLGIGVGIRMVAGQPAIAEVIGRSPAERAGLRVGDVVARIDGQPVDGSAPKRSTSSCAATSAAGCGSPSAGWAAARRSSSSCCAPT
jgi:carboxyl-terminal processing protease